MARFASDQVSLALAKKGGLARAEAIELGRAMEIRISGVLDYGTNSVRAVVVDCADGRSVGAHVFDYPSGEQGILLDAKEPHLARQNPADYVEGLRASGEGGARGGRAHSGLRTGRVVGSASTPPARPRFRWTARTVSWRSNAAELMAGRRSAWSSEPTASCASP